MGPDSGLDSQQAANSGRRNKSQEGVYFTAIAGVEVGGGFKILAVIYVHGYVYENLTTFPFKLNAPWTKH